MNPMRTRWITAAMIDDVDLRLILAFVLLRGENSFGSFEIRWHLGKFERSAMTDDVKE
jgi:hypothetical protein